MSDTVASLGFAVDASGLKEGQTELGNTTVKAKALEDQANKTGAAISKVGSPTKDLSNNFRSASVDAVSFSTAQQKVVDSLEQQIVKTQLTSAEMRVYQALQKAGTTLETDAGKAIAARALVLDAALNSTKNSTVGNAELGRALNALFPALTTTGAATKILTAEHAAHNAALTGLRGTVQGMNSVVGQFGGSLGGLAGLAGAARLGIAGLAVAAGTALVVAMGNSRDEIEKTNFRLKAFAGESNGAKIGADLKKASDAAGVMPSQIAPAVESVLQLQNALLHADPHLIYAPGYNPFDSITGGASGAVRAVQTVTEQFKLNKLDSGDATKATNEFFDSIKKNSGLTAQEFSKLTNQAPTFAQAMAKAFGANSVYDFQKALEQLPVPLQEVFQAIARMGPTTDAQFKQAQAGSKSFGDAVDDLQKKFKDMWIAMSGGDQPTDTVSKVIKAVGDSLDEIRQNAPEIKNQLDLLGGAERDFADNFKRDESKVSGWNVNVVGAVGSVLGTLGRLPTQGIQILTDWANGAIAEFQRMAAGAVSAAQTAASALASIGKAAGGSFNQSVNNSEGGNAYDGPALSPGAQGGDSGGGTGTGTAIDYGGVGDYLGDIPAFATGTDNAPGGLTRINEHGGEIVNLPSGSQVIPHDISMQMAGAIQGLTTLQGQTGVVSATPDPASMATVKEITDAIDQSTIDISKKVLAGSDNIVNALNKLIGGVSAPTLNPSTGLPVSSSGTSSGSSYQTINGGRQLINPEGGGGGGISFGKASPQRPPPPQPPIDPKDFLGNPNYGYPGGARGRARPVRGFKSGPGSFRSGSPAGQFAPSTNNYGGYMPLDPSMFDYLDSGYYDTGYATVGDGYDYGTSPYNDYGYSDYAGYDTGYTGGDFGVGGSTVGDVASQYMGSGGYDYTSGGFGFDPGYMDYGGGSADYGYFKEGGQFIVGGPEGTDKSLVKIHATKGETVTVTPNGVPPPSSVAMPAVANSPAPAPDPSASNTSSTTTKIVNMYLHPGVQAEQMLRSRAQIARGM